MSGHSETEGELVGPWVLLLQAQESIGGHTSRWPSCNPTAMKASQAATVSGLWAGRLTLHTRVPPWVRVRRPPAPWVLISACLGTWGKPARSKTLEQGAACQLELALAGKGV